MKLKKIMEKWKCFRTAARYPETDLVPAFYNAYVEEPFRPGALRWADTKGNLLSGGFLSGITG